MKDLEKELKKLSAELLKLQKAGKLEGYCLIGALAVSARARPRATKDIDFMVSAERDFFFNFFPQLLKQKGYSLKVYRGDIFDPVNGLIRIYDKKDNTEFADIVPVLWKWQDEIVKASEIINFSGIALPIARIEDLIILKLKAGGTQDMLDIEELLKTAQISKKIDKERLFSLAERAAVSKNLKRLIDNFKI